MYHEITGVQQVLHISTIPPCVHMMERMMERILCQGVMLSPDVSIPALQAFPHGALAYFNCGEEAGASQPHKHTQIVPLPLAEGSACTGTPFEGVLRDAQAHAGAQEMQPFLVRSLPYECHAADLSERCA